MTNYSVGHEAEKHAARYLEAKGFTIKELNWKTRLCEIDIVALKQDTVYFFEVKYRQSGRQGDGLDYITASKLKQMRFAAEVWMQAHRWNGECSLGAIEVSGEYFRITNCALDII